MTEFFTNCIVFIIIFAQVVREITAVVRKFYEERRPMSRDRGQLAARLQFNDNLQTELEAQRQRVASSVAQWGEGSYAWYVFSLSRHFWFCIG